MQSPYGISPDPTTFYLTPAIRSAVDMIRYTIEDRQGLSMILGDVGLGKSTLLRYLYSGISADERYVPALLLAAGHKTPFMLLKAISQGFGLSPCRSLMAQQDALETFLVEQYEAGKIVVVFMDEAQALSVELLEVVRTLLNFETTTCKLIQLVLSGQLDLRDKLLAKRNKALKSRIMSPCMMKPLQQDEVAAMLRFRADRAGAPDLFTPASIATLYAIARGVPRETLRIAWHAHAAAMASNCLEITPAMVSEAWQNTEMEEPDASAQESAR